MKQSIHPKWNTLTVTCVCGNTFESASTNDSIAVDICAKCHPFFTNEMRFVDRKGRVDRFRQQQERAQQLAKNGGSKSKEKKQSQDTLSFKEILQVQKTNL